MKQFFSAILAAFFLIVCCMANDEPKPDIGGGVAGSHITSSGAKATDFAGIKTRVVCFPMKGYGNTINSNGTTSYDPSKGWYWTKQILTVETNTYYDHYYKGLSFKDRLNSIYNYITTTPGPGTNTQFDRGFYLSPYDYTNCDYSTGVTNHEIFWNWDGASYYSLWMPFWDVSGCTNSSASLPADTSGYTWSGQTNSYGTYFIKSGATTLAVPYFTSSGSGSIGSHVFSPDVTNSSGTWSNYSFANSWYSPNPITNVFTHQISVGTNTYTDSYMGIKTVAYTNYRSWSTPSPCGVSGGISYPTPPYYSDAGPSTTNSGWSPYGGSYSGTTNYAISLVLGQNDDGDNRNYRQERFAYIVKYEYDDPVYVTNLESAATNYFLNVNLLDKLKHYYLFDDPATNGAVMLQWNPQKLTLTNILLNPNTTSYWPNYYIYSQKYTGAGWSGDTYWGGMAGSDLTPQFKIPNNLTYGDTNRFRVEWSFTYATNAYGTVPTATRVSEYVTNIITRLDPPSVPFVNWIDYQFTNNAVTTNQAASTNFIALNLKSQQVYSMPTFEPIMYAATNPFYVILYPMTNYYASNWVSISTNGYTQANGTTNYWPALAAYGSTNQLIGQTPTSDPYLYFAESLCYLLGNNTNVQTNLLTQKVWFVDDSLTATNDVTTNCPTLSFIRGRLTNDYWFRVSQKVFISWTNLPTNIIKSGVIYYH